LLTQEIARFADCEQSEVKRREERRNPVYYRLLKSFTLGSYEGNSSVHPVETLDADSIVKFSERVVEEAAAGGDCVIVGRGSQHFLRDRDDTLRFFLYGSKEGKIRRLISEGQEEADAQILVDNYRGTAYWQYVTNFAIVGPFALIELKSKNPWLRHSDPLYSSHATEDGDSHFR